MKKATIIASLLLVLMLSSCGLPVRLTEVRGSGNIQTETRYVSGFQSVELSGIGTLNIVQGDKESLEITTDDNLLEYIQSEVSGRRLMLGTQEYINLQPTNDVVYQLTVTDLNSVVTSGLGDVRMSSLETGDLQLVISGAGNITIDDLTADNVDLGISGLGNVELSGRISQQDVKISGAGNYKAKDLFSRVANIKISGTGSSTVWAADKLTVELSGMGSVDYYGDPILNMDISGMGKVNSLGSR
jgi:hypothetical protein